MDKYRISNNAVRKMAKVNIAFSEVEIALERGKVFYRTGAIIYFLGKNDLPKDKSFEKLNGLTVIVKDYIVVTIYKNKKVLRDIKQKAKRNNRKNFEGYGKSSSKFCPYHHAFNNCDCNLDMGLVA